MQNASLGSQSTVAERVAQRALADRSAAYEDEVRRMLDAGLAVIRRCGTGSRPRVADIVAEAGLSNDAFYRHFASKDALITALLEDGTETLCSYLEHQLAKEPSAQGQVRCWLETVMSQAAGDVAATTRAVLWNAGTVGAGMAAGRHFSTAALAALLVAPFALLGSTDAAHDATLVAHAVMGTLADHLWAGTCPTAEERDRLLSFCLAVVSRP
ncbi:MAG: TetR/AcrR family transcriptional regulator [Mycobacteriales bacterium]